MGEKTSLSYFVIKLLILTQLVSFIFLSVGFAQPLGISELLAMWRAERYREVIPLLIDYRNCPYGKNVQIDYMIATSCCRIDELSDIGQRYFERILSSYELSDNDSHLIRRERERCSTVEKPTVLAFLNSRTAIGSDVGVRGKTYFHVDRENAPIGTDLIHIVRDIPSICAVASGPQVGTLKHELFHLMVRNKYGDIPPWLDEGLASLYDVSRFEGPRLVGLRNWREDVVEHYRQDCPASRNLGHVPGAVRVSIAHIANRNE